MVVHGGVDGFSRAVVFLRCSNNNEANHIEPLFDDENYGIGLYRRTVNLVEEFQQDLNQNVYTE